jgi:hypothetical protein
MTGEKKSQPVKSWDFALPVRRKAVCEPAVLKFLGEPGFYFVGSIFTAI